MSKEMFWVFVITTITLGSFITGHTIGYKQGQIDAANGKRFYCLEVQADQSSAWTYHKEGCDK